MHSGHLWVTLKWNRAYALLPFMWREMALQISLMSWICSVP